MLFKKDIEIEKINKNCVSTNYREAVRAIVIKNNKILMVHSKNNDYKFPGGGVKKKEDKIIALKREVEEETGYICSNIDKCIGIVTEKSIDRYCSNRMFKMISLYYLVQVYDVCKKQKLDAYEKELEFKPVWISVEEAIEKNNNIINTRPDTMANWIERETYVLKEINLAIKKRLIKLPGK